MIRTGVNFALSVFFAVVLLAVFVGAPWSFVFADDTGLVKIGVTSPVTGPDWQIGHGSCSNLNAAIRTNDACRAEPLVQWSPLDVFEFLVPPIPATATITDVRVEVICHGGSSSNLIDRTFTVDVLRDAVPAGDPIAAVCASGTEQTFDFSFAPTDWTPNDANNPTSGVRFTVQSGAAATVMIDHARVAFTYSTDTEPPDPTNTRVLTWNASSGAMSYTVAWSVDYSLFMEWDIVGNVLTHTIDETDLPVLAPGEVLFFNVYACNAGGCSIDTVPPINADAERVLQ